MKHFMNCTEFVFFGTVKPVYSVSSFSYNIATLTLFVKLLDPVRVFCARAVYVTVITYMTSILEKKFVNKILLKRLHSQSKYSYKTK